MPRAVKLERTFPLLIDSRYGKNHPEWPRQVPWDFVAPHGKQAHLNHHQTVNMLAERGGLSPGELLAVLRGEGARTLLTDDLAMPQVEALLSAWNRRAKETR